MCRCWMLGLDNMTFAVVVAPTIIIPKCGDVTRQSGHWVSILEGIIRVLGSSVAS